MRGKYSVVLPGEGTLWNSIDLYGYSMELHGLSISMDFHGFLECLHGCSLDFVSSQCHNHLILRMSIRNSREVFQMGHSQNKVVMTLQRHIVEGTTMQAV